jgi:hypothetical protein
MSKYDLDPGSRGPVVAHDTSTYYKKHLCQVISDSFNKWQGYGPDNKSVTDGQIDGAYFYIPFFFFEKAGNNKLKWT